MTMFKTNHLEDTEFWLRLLLTSGVGSVTARKLLATFGSPEAIFKQNLLALGHIVSQKQAQALLNPPPNYAQACEQLQQWLEQNSAHHVISLGHTSYPQKLLETPDPPLLLFANGNLELLSKPSLAIVGSRSPTPQGKETAQDFARTLSRQGITIVSGLALGIDGIAQQAALKEAGSTIAVLGTGIDRVYPASHHALTHDIAQNGLLLSEYPLGTAPTTHNFPKRNRIIAGLSLGTLVVEATIHSGSLITAKMAAEMGKEVFAIPGSIHSPQSKGCHWLIKQGAKLVETAQEVIEELRLPVTVSHSPNKTTQKQTQDPHPVTDQNESPSLSTLILDAIGQGPTSFDAITQRTGLNAALLQAELLTLELNQQIARMPGGLFQQLHS
ncbi:MAG: DNA-processing protein DprA [Saezia sp.]